MKGTGQLKFVNLKCSSTLTVRYLSRLNQTSFDSGISNKLHKYREDANDLNKPGRFCIVSEIPESRKQ